MQLEEEEEGLLQELLEEEGGVLEGPVEVLDAAGKREFDDYGHMRFGKRASGGEDDYGQDDYGHLRFGRSYHPKENYNYYHKFNNNDNKMVNNRGNTGDFSNYHHHQHPQHQHQHHRFVNGGQGQKV